MFIDSLLHSAASESLENRSLQPGGKTAANCKFGFSQIHRSICPLETPVNLPVIEQSYGPWLPLPKHGDFRYVKLPAFWEMVLQRWRVATFGILVITK